VREDGDGIRLFLERDIGIRSRAAVESIVTGTTDADARLAGRLSRKLSGSHLLRLFIPVLKLNMPAEHLSFPVRETRVVSGMD